MREQSRKAWKRWPTSWTAAAAAGFVALAAPTSFELAASNADTVACRVLEVSSAEGYGVTLIIFHHRDQNDRARLAALLRQHSGGSVQFQAADGAWHPAIVLRLKSCFGRGLLVSSASVRLVERGEFMVRFPASHEGARLNRNAGDAPRPSNRLRRAERSLLAFLASRDQLAAWAAFLRVDVGGPGSSCAGASVDVLQWSSFGRQGGANDCASLFPFAR